LIGNLKTPLLHFPPSNPSKLFIKIEKSRRKVSSAPARPLCRHSPTAETAQHQSRIEPFLLKVAYNFCRHSGQQIDNSLLQVVSSLTNTTKTYPGHAANPSQPKNGSPPTSPSTRYSDPPPYKAKKELGRPRTRRHTRPLRRLHRRPCFPLGVPFPSTCQT